MPLAFPSNITILRRGVFWVVLEELPVIGQKKLKLPINP